jgi:hypothetical protein
MRARDTQRIEQRSRVVGHIGNRKRLLRLV